MGPKDGVPGGCQGGACRFGVAPGPVRQSVRHRRMCQRAVSNTFAPLAEAVDDRVARSGAPEIFAASDLGARGRCAPLFLHAAGADATNFMADSYDAPDAVSHTHTRGNESRAPWLDPLARRPARKTDLPAGASVVSHPARARHMTPAASCVNLPSPGRTTPAAPGVRAAGWAGGTSPVFGPEPMTRTKTAARTPALAADRRCGSKFGRRIRARTRARR